MRRAASLSGLHASHLWNPTFFITTRHAASLRSSNNCKCVIEIFFIARGESPLHKGLNPCGAFGGFPFGIRRFKTDSPVP